MFISIKRLLSLTNIANGVIALITGYYEKEIMFLLFKHMERAALLKVLMN
jgi:hypothetical protein